MSFFESTDGRGEDIEGGFPPATPTELSSELMVVGIGEWAEGTPLGVDPLVDALENGVGARL